MIDPAHELPLGPEELKDVGEFIVVWNLIEAEMDEILLNISGLDMDAIDAIMSNPNVPSRMDVFTAIFNSSIKDQALRERGGPGL